MTTASKREKLRNFIDTADDQQVKAFYNKIEGYIAGKSGATGSLIKMEKSELLKHASNDPLFLADLKEKNDDFAKRSQRRDASRLPDRRFARQTKM